MFDGGGEKNYAAYASEDYGEKYEDGLDSAELEGKSGDDDDFDEDKEDDSWLYLPAIGKPKRISAGNQKDSFMRRRLLGLIFSIMLCMRLASSPNRPVSSLRCSSI